MVVVIFESWPKSGKVETYLELAESLAPLVKDFDGFISVERFQSVTEKGKMVALSYWRDEEAVAAWRNVVEHRRVQDASRKKVFDDYRLRVATVVRDYSMRTREQAPLDSLHAHG